MNPENKKLVCGVGVNDADYAVANYETISCADGKQKRKQVWLCPYYERWTHMLARCYSTKTQERYPTYIDCSVSKEWHTFSSFKSWMEKQDWKNKQLDKDLLFEGNKVYSAETCVFVTQTVNSFTTDRGSDRGEWLIGVYLDKGTNKFKSQCSNPFTKKRESLGYFTCQQEAHKAWMKRKIELSHLLAAEQTDERVAKALILKYTNYKASIS